MKNWQVQEAKSRFSELLRASAQEGPQLVSHHGKPTAVVLPFEQWQRLQQHQPRSLKEFLLASAPRFELAIPPRGKWRSRAVPAFNG